MPNVLLDIVATPNIIASGGATTLVITYQSATMGALELRTSAPFTISKTRVILAPDESGHWNEVVTIKRIEAGVGPRRCDLLGTFFDTSLHFFVEVTS